jgi:hypothetical protein
MACECSALAAHALPSTAPSRARSGAEAPVAARTHARGSSEGRGFAGMSSLCAVSQHGSGRCRPHARARACARARLCTRRRTHARALEMRRRTGVVIAHPTLHRTHRVWFHPTPPQPTLPRPNRAEGRVHAQVHKLAELEAACEVASAARLAGVPEPQHAATATTLLGSFGGSTGTADAPEAAADARALLAMLQARSGADRRVAAPAWQHGATRGYAVQTRCNTWLRGANTVQHVATRCKHGATRGYAVQTRCKHGANTVQTRCKHVATRCSTVQHLAGLHPSGSARRRASQCGIAAPDP